MAVKSVFSGSFLNFQRKNENLTYQNRIFSGLKELKFKICEFFNAGQRNFWSIFAVKGIVFIIQKQKSMVQVHFFDINYLPTLFWNTNYANFNGNTKRSAPNFNTIVLNCIISAHRFKMFPRSSVEVWSLCTDI